MRTQFSRRRNSFVTPGRLTVALILAFIVVASVVVSYFFPTLPQVAARPLFGMGTGLAQATRGFSSVFGDSAQLTAQVDRLVEENLALQNENRILRAKLADLSALSGGSALDSKGIPAGVLSRPPLSPYDTLTIEMPEGVVAREGALVYGTGGVPIGTIAKGGTVAQVELFSSSGRVTQGWVGEARLAIDLTGETAGAFTTVLPRGSAIVAGDIVYLPGPGAIPAGTVVAVESDPASTDEILRIAPYVNIFSITWVLVAP